MSFVQKQKVYIVSSSSIIMVESLGVIKKITCHKCYYEWKTNSNLLMVTCPNCGRKTVGKRDYRGVK